MFFWWKRENWLCRKRPSVGLMFYQFVLYKNIYILYKNIYSPDLVDKCIKEFSDNVLAPNPIVSKLPKSNLVIARIYSCKFSFQNAQELVTQWKTNSLSVVSRLFTILSSALVIFLHLKTKFHRSQVLALKTKRHFKVRMCEHLRILAVAGKRVKSDDEFFIKEHLLYRNYLPDFEDFSILTTSKNDFIVTLMNSILPDRDQPLLNNKQPLHLELFDS